MNKEKLSIEAKSLRDLLLKYSKENQDVLSARQQLSRLVDMAIKKKVDTPLQWNDVPCGRMFTDGELGQYRDLESKYSKFKVEITGGHADILGIIDEIRNTDA